jgi:sulfur transfer complex TusBCD TusB component (DsrH family)
MAQKLLHIIETAYRATLEEQDDPVLWLAQALRGAGADAHVLLKGNAVNYAVRGQDAEGLAFGERRQTQPPRLLEDLARFSHAGGTVYAVEEDFLERGIQQGEVVDGVSLVKTARLPALFHQFDQVWQW